MEETKDNKIIYIVITILLVVGAFAGGYFLHGSLSKGETEKETTNSTGSEITTKSEEETTDSTGGEITSKSEEVNKTTNAMDNMVVNLYGGGYIYYVVNGSLYYLEAELLNDGRYFLLTYSPCVKGEQSDYCNGNPVYKRNAVKVDGIENVEKIRLLHRPGATDESFSTFAVDKEGNAYIINKTNATKYYGNNDVEDIISDTQVLLKDGTTKAIK